MFRGISDISDNKMVNRTQPLTVWLMCAQSVKSRWTSAAAAAVVVCI
jgi:hypothetical protein